VLFIHGMNQRGYRDPRVVNTSNALARCGFEVVVPNLDDVAASTISERSIDQIASAILALNDTAMPLGLMAPSFSAALSLIAAGRPGVSSKVASICAIGGFADASRVVRYLIEDPAADEYGRVIAYKNFLPELANERPAVLAALETKLTDMALVRTSPKYGAHRAGLSEDDRGVLDGMLNDIDVRRGHAATIERRYSELFAKLSVLAVASSIGAPVALIHGARDNVILAEESRCLAAALRASGTDTYLSITPLLTPGTTSPSITHLLQGPDLIRGFAHFFGPLLGGARRTRSRPRTRLLTTEHVANPEA
jgi:pimeloyl-ACP methyl ester carboxylesterase